MMKISNLNWLRWRRHQQTSTGSATPDFEHHDIWARLSGVRVDLDDPERPLVVWAPPPDHVRSGGLTLLALPERTGGREQG